MSQVQQVVRCYSCHTFQVQIAKKSNNKWQCKICQEKQSITKVYFSGLGAECRKIVQDLNLQRGHLAEIQTALASACEETEEGVEAPTDPGPQLNTRQVSRPVLVGVSSSRWAAYLPPVSASSHDQPGGGDVHDEDCPEETAGAAAERKVGRAGWSRVPLANRRTNPLSFPPNRKSEFEGTSCQRPAVKRQADGKTVRNRNEEEEGGQRRGGYGARGSDTSEGTGRWKHYAVDAEEQEEDDCPEGSGRKQDRQIQLPPSSQPCEQEQQRLPAVKPPSSRWSQFLCEGQE